MREINLAIDLDLGWRRCWGGRVEHYFQGRMTLCDKSLYPHTGHTWVYSGSYPKCKKCLAIFREHEAKEEDDARQGSQENQEGDAQVLA